MTFALVPSEDQIQQVVRNFLLAILPAGTEIFQGQDNRVPEPSTTDFVIMTAIRRERLETNIDKFLNATFTGSITGSLLTVTSISSGALVVGASLFGTGIVPTTISSFGSGSGGVGTYNLDTAQSVSSELMAAGQQTLTQPTQVVFQLDVHSSDFARASDMAQIISTAMRDDYASQQFATSGFDVAPLYADDPRQMPFINEEQQYETRWIVEAAVQANQVLSGIPQQSATAVTINTTSIEATYAP